MERIKTSKTIPYSVRLEPKTIAAIKKIAKKNNRSLKSEIAYRIMLMVERDK